MYAFFGVPPSSFLHSSRCERSKKKREKAETERHPFLHHIFFFFSLTQTTPPKNKQTNHKTQYSFSLTTFSPSGKLVQIEYALNAVASGATSLGLTATVAVLGWDYAFFDGTSMATPHVSAVAAIVCEHHGQDDGYLPAPMLLATALAAPPTLVDAYLQQLTLATLARHGPRWCWCRCGSVRARRSPS